MGREKFWKFFGKQWTDVLYDFLVSDEFKKIGRFVKEQKQKNKLIAPDEEFIFRAFKECPWNKVHTIILSIEPYCTMINAKEFTADGLALSARLSISTPFTLQKFYQEIDEEIYDGNGENLGITNDLTYLANQGILLLNASLTSSVGERMGAHWKIWEPFIKYVLQKVNSEKSSIGVILMGTIPQYYESLLNNESFYVLKCEHPLESLDRGTRKWNSNKSIKQLTNWHKTFHNIKIEWSEKDNSGTDEQTSLPDRNTAGIF